MSERLSNSREGEIDELMEKIMGWLKDYQMCAADSVIDFLTPNDRGRKRSSNGGPMEGLIGEESLGLDDTPHVYGERKK